MRPSRPSFTLFVPFNGITRLEFTVRWALPALLSALALTGSIYKVYSFEVGELDYGLFTNIIWNFSQGNGWLASLYADQARVNFLADHLALLIPLISPAFMLFPSPYTLAVLHGAAYTATFFLVPVVVREIWRSAGREDYLHAALFLTLALSVFKGFTAAWRFQSHMTTLTMPFVLCALIALHRKSLRWTVFWCILLTMGQERSALATFGVGTYAMLITGNPRFGLATCLFATSYFFAAVKWIIPSFAGSAGKYIYTSFINPSFALWEKFLFTLNLLFYWALLPIAGRRSMLASVSIGPLVAIGLLSNRRSMYSFSHHYHDYAAVFLCVASAHGLLWLRGREWFTQIPKAAFLAVGIAFITFSANYSFHTLPVRIVLRMLNTPASITQLNADIARYQDIPARFTVYATPWIGTRFALRENVRPLSAGALRQLVRGGMVFIAPRFHAPEELQGMLAAIAANPTLHPVADTGELLAYESRELDPPREGPVHAMSIR